MSPEARPEAVPFEPGSGALPPALDPAITDPDTPILLLVVPERDAEAARVAIDLAEAAAARGGETVLADASMGAPTLHEHLEVQNLEGLADVFLFGASVHRVRTRPPGHGFDFVPPGAYIPDPAAVLESDRWEGIAGSLAASGGRMLLYVPGTSPGIGPLSKRVGRAALIGDPASVQRWSSRLDPSCEIVAVVEPVSAAVEPKPDVAPAARPREEPAPADEDAVVLRSDDETRRSVSPVLLLILLAVLVAAGWYLYREYFTAPVTPQPVEQPAPAQEPAADPAPATADATPLRYSVAVEAHQDLPTAQERVAALRRAEPDLDFYLAPVVVREDLYYRVLAGPVVDSAAGHRLMNRLVEERHKSAPDSWSIMPTEHAFDLGEFDSRADADARVDSLAALDIPTYVIAIPQPAGSERYRVYGGAYVSESEAQVMRDLLTEAGVEARLVPRTGEPILEAS